MGKLKFGWSEKSLTPEKRVSLAGQFAERISEYVEKPVTVTALAIDSGEDYAVICSADLVNIGYNLVCAVREEVKKQLPDFDTEKIIIAAIHTHTGPVYTRTSRFAAKGDSTSKGLLKAMLPPHMKYVESVKTSVAPDIATSDEMLALITKQTADAVVEAWQNRKEGAYVNAFGRAAVGMCRRASYSDGSAQMWGNTNTAVFDSIEGGSDTGIELMYLFDGEKKLTGVIANLACPAQCVQHRLFVSPDFWGETKMLLRKRFGEKLFLLPLCSAAGDQCPVDLVRWVEPESDVHDPNITKENPLPRKADPSMFDLSGMRKAGKRVANEIMEIYDEGLSDAVTDAPFTHVTETWKLPVRRVSMTQAENARKIIAEYLDKKGDTVDFNDAAKLQVHLGTLYRYQVQDYADVLDTEIHIIRMGNIAFATNPFELFLDFGNQIKARSLAEQTFLVQLANGMEGYLPTEKAEKGGHYSAFVSSGKVGHQGGEQLVRLTLDKIRNLFMEEAQ